MTMIQKHFQVQRPSNSPTKRTGGTNIGGMADVNRVRDPGIFWFTPIP
jgi:hypothetical protein